MEKELRGEEGDMKKGRTDHPVLLCKGKHERIGGKQNTESDFPVLIIKTVLVHS